MSAEENKALVRNILEEAYNKGNLDVIDEHLAPDYVHHNPPTGVPNDREGYKQAVTMLRTAFPDYHITIDDMIAEGDKVVLRLHWSGTHKGEFMGIPPTGKHITVEGISIHRIEGGKIVEQKGMVDSMSMMQQLGVVPPLGQGGR